MSGGKVDPEALAAKHTLAELKAMFSEAMGDPENKNPHGGVLIYKKPAQKRIDAIGDAISLHLKQRKIDSGTYETNGYSGRNSNRR